MLRTCLLVYYITFNVLYGCHGESLGFILPAQQRDCLYYPRNEGERMIVDMQIREGEPVDFQLYDPENHLLQTRFSMRQLSLDRPVNQKGDYAFCFDNRHSYTKSSIVEFDYEDNEHEDRETQLTKKFLLQKREFIKDILAKKPQKNYPGERLQPNNTIEGIEQKLAFISINLDHASFYITRQKAKLAYHGYLAESNLSYVSYSAICISLAIIIVGMIQVIALKGFINGKMNFKVWQF